MWELVSRSLPFHGLHHGEIIHKVVTDPEDLRPGPWPWPSPLLSLPPGYIPFVKVCWARQANSRPAMPQVLEQLVQMLTHEMMLTHFPRLDQVGENDVL